MRSRRPLLALACFLLAAACSRPLDSAAEPPRGAAGRDRLPASPEVQAMLDGRARTLPHAGIAAGLLDAAGRRFLAAGTRNGPGTPPPDARSVFEIGSVTKVFTATLLAEMAGRGEVRLDEPVAGLLPASVRVPSRDGRAIALLDLATERGEGGALGRAMRQTHAPRRPTAAPGMAIGLGWHVVRASGVVWHNGGTGGYHSFVGFDPARGVGVVLLANSDLSLDQLGRRLLDPATAGRPAA